MALFNETIQVPPKTWTLITSPGGIESDVRLQQQAGNITHIQARATNVDPTTFSGDIIIRNDGGEFITLGRHFVGVLNADFLFAWADKGATLSVSHA